VTTTGITTAQKFKGGSGTPTLAGGTAAGAGPTLSMTTGSTDAAGGVNVVVGTGPSGANSATIVTVTFAAPYTTAPFVVLQPTNFNAATFSTRPVFILSNATNFTLNLGVATALTAGTAYSWAYHAIQ
jgi:hypothetical protein